jgi:hypothetical protein
MMRTWEEKVKFRFGNVDFDDEEDGWEVSVGRVPDNTAKKVYDGFHTMNKFVTYIRFHSWLFIDVTGMLQV